MTAEILSKTVVLVYSYSGVSRQLLMQKLSGLAGVQLDLTGPGYAAGQDCIQVGHSKAEISSLPLFLFTQTQDIS